MGSSTSGHRSTASTVIVLTTVLLSLLVSARGVEDTEFWLDVGERTLKEALGVTLNKGRAKNTILFVGDGMGPSTVTAARIYKGQLSGQSGESSQLTFEKFPHLALSKTYCVDRQTPGSASTGTAYHSGVKANFGTVGVDARVTRRNCAAMTNPSVRVTTVLDYSLREGKSVGIVTNTRVTHASPAGAYAHSPDRNYERDVDSAQHLPGKCVPDVATQLVRENFNITVVLGGGRRGFTGRADGRELINEWTAKGGKRRYVKNAAEMRSLDVGDTDYLLGLFTESHMTWDNERDNNLEPSLAEMTRKAIEVLSKNPKGYYLFVEGGRIDHGHHQNWAKRALVETVSFDLAVEEALAVTNSQDTLVVVTADHSHPFNLVGYPKRGNDILGLVDPVDPGQETTDGKPYTTLVYGNGPGPLRAVDLTAADTKANDFEFPVAVPVADDWETHSGEDVAIYAKGPMAHLFHGVHEQNYIAIAMAYASCVGPNKAHCGAEALGGAGGGLWKGPLGGALLAVVITHVVVLRGGGGGDCVVGVGG